ncbi:MAG: hypothetical protein AAGA85_05065 [Bacteroidota bacterium]
MDISEFFILRTKFRDRIIFLLYAVLITALFYFAIAVRPVPDSATITFLVLVIAQFYLSAFLRFPVESRFWRLVAYTLFFTLNFLLFRQLALAMAPLPATRTEDFLWLLVILFGLTLVGRNIRMYISLIANLEKLNALRVRNQLFSKPEEITINFGEEGKLTLHPNEIVYIRTMTAGDHTKIFGIKERKSESEQGKLVEYNTTAYQNFNEIFKDLIHFPQFKRISQSTVINFQYPYEEKNGTMIIESRRFTISPKYSQKRMQKK